MVVGSPTGASSSQSSEKRSALNTGQTLGAGRGMGPPDTTWFQCMGCGMEVILSLEFVGQQVGLYLSHHMQLVCILLVVLDLL